MERVIRAREERGENVAGEESGRAGGTSLPTESRVSLRVKRDGRA